MIVDTTYLVDLWREEHLQESPARRVMSTHEASTLVVPAHAAGEFPEGGAAMSEARLAESLAFLRLFRIGDVTIETALWYARIVAMLRNLPGLLGRSKPDLWIAAWATEHSAPLVTRNLRHFQGIADLELIPY